MPIYEYRCEDCQNRFEVLQRLGSGPEGLLCPACGSPHLAKQFSTFASAAASASSSSLGAASAGGCAGGG